MIVKKTRNHKAVFMLVLVATLVFVNHAVAESNAPCLFIKADVNGDGSVSRSEADRVRQRVFARFDLDQNGVITSDEIRIRQDQIAMRAELQQIRLGLATSRMDADGDGGLTPDEMKDGPDLFTLLDRNDDQMISLEEISTLRAAMGFLPTK